MPDEGAARVNDSPVCAESLLPRKIGCIDARLRGEDRGICATGLYEEIEGGQTKAGSTNQFKFISKSFGICLIARRYDDRTSKNDFTIWLVSQQHKRRLQCNI